MPSFDTLTACTRPNCGGPSDPGGLGDGTGGFGAIAAGGTFPNALQVRLNLPLSASKTTTR